MPDMGVDPSFRLGRLKAFDVAHVVYVVEYDNRLARVRRPPEFYSGSYLERLAEKYPRDPDLSIHEPV